MKILDAVEKDTRNNYNRVLNGLTDELFDGYTVIKREMAIIFALNAQGTLTLDHLKKN